MRNNDPDSLFKEIQEQLQKEKMPNMGILGKLVIAIIVAVLVHEEQYGVAAFIAMFFLL